MSSPFRINDSLYQEAETYGLLLRRSAAKQVEYWAELGKRVDEVATASDLLALMQGIAKVRIETPEMASVDPIDVFTSVNQKRGSGKLGQSITRNAVYYEASENRVGLLDQVMPDGSRKTGHFSNGEFIAE